jgi:hypothetical protein
MEEYSLLKESAKQNRWLAAIGSLPDGEEAQAFAECQRMISSQYNPAKRELLINGMLLKADAVVSQVCDIPLSGGEEVSDVSGFPKGLFKYFQIQTVEADRVTAVELRQPLKSIPMIPFELKATSHTKVFPIEKIFRVVAVVPAFEPQLAAPVQGKQIVVPTRYIKLSSKK